MPTEVQYIIWGFFILLALVIIDLVSRWAVALYTSDLEKRFDWNKVLVFLKKNVAPYILIWIVLALVPLGLKYASNLVGFEIDLSGIIATNTIVGIVWGIIVARFTMSIIGNFKELQIEIKNNNQ